MVRILSEDAVLDVLDLGALLDAVETGFVAQYRGAVERPTRPRYPIGRGLEGAEPLGTGLVMPAYVHGAPIAVTKLVGVFEGNAHRDLPTIQAQIVAVDARTGEPEAILDGTVVTNARTGCIGGVAARRLAEEPVTLGVLGAGTQARWQTRAIGAAMVVDEVRVYSPSDSRVACATELGAEGFTARAVDSPAAAVEGASVVVTATTSHEPVFPADALEPGALVVGIGAYTPEMQELEAAVLDEAEVVFADVPEEVADIGDLRASARSKADLIPLGALFAGDVEIPPPGATVVVESVGSAVLDAVATEHLLEVATEDDIGDRIAL
ncbi:MAG: ornithine cyclodeaminase family protein [Halobacteriota archaeon]